MKYKAHIKCIICLIWAGLWLLTSNSTGQGARVAGEKGVASSTSQENPEARKSDRRRPPPRRRPTPQRPVREKEKAIPKKVIDEKKRVPKKEKPETRYVTIDFDNVDITIFIKFISELTGKNFVIDRAVKGKVTIISPTKITAKEAYKVFESVLEVHGYAAIPAGKIIKIVPALQARSKDIETRLRKEAITPEDRVVTQLIPLRYADPNELKKLFGPFISKTSVIVSYTPTGMLIVTDVLSNIKRLLSIIEVIDVEGIGEEISVIPLEHATASVLGKSLTTVFQRGRVTRGKKVVPGAPVVRIVPDERTNSLITLASEDDTARIKQLINLLDKETPRGEGDIHVHYLQNAIAEDLAKVLMAIPGQDVKAPQKGKAPVISKEVHIVADKATNSLVITAKKDDFLVLEDVIKKLDIARKMVYIEALIMEVDVDKDFKLGVEWRGMTEGHSGGGFIGSGGIGDTGAYDIFPEISGTQTVTATFPSGFSLGVLGAPITISGVIFPSIGAVVRNYQNDSDVHILSTPQILTTDNEEAEINVGENVPYLTKEASGDQQYSTYEYKDVGVKLKITPQINQERFVRLKIFQEVIKLKKGTASFTPTTLKRTAETTVIVKDENTVVIGGIIGESTERGRYKTPCLGSIPVLRRLGTSSYRTRNKTNLFIFLTPRIIENPVEAKKIYEEKREEIDRVQEGVIRMYDKRGRKKEDIQLSDLGYRHLQAKEYDKAKEYFEKALEINPDNPYAILNMGVIYEWEGKRDEAIKMYERVISLSPEDRDFSASDPERKGRKLLDIAKDNLKNLEKEGR
ncbi:MAG: type II secretion system secretin GspD [Desulfobacteraceae bacterium]|nr:type II secretion system secretin GspD [Desulfobacteraceae bacterium]